MLPCVVRLLASLCIVSIAPQARASDARSLDVVGIHLGMKPDDAMKIAKDVIKDGQPFIYSGPLKQGSFTSEPITFGASIYGPWNVEGLQFEFSTNPAIGLIFITRRTSFDHSGQSILISTLKQSLFQKYGPPSYETVFVFLGEPAQYEIYWAFSPSIKIRPGTKPAFGSTVAKCAENLGETSPFDAMRGRLNPSMAEKARCGTWMHVTIYPNQQDRQLAAHMDLVFADQTAVADSYAYAMDLMQKGSDASAAATRAKAAENQPKL